MVEESIIPNAKGVPSAIFTSFAYVERTARPDPARPVLFAFNGGPGAASIWMHFGLLGPRRIFFPDPVNPPTAAPFTIADNPHAPLDVADVVMIDPPLTGFSRMLPGAKAEDFLGVTADARAFAEFIHQWLTRHGRWNSPKYLIGESYGTIRAIAVASELTGGVFPPRGTLGAVTVNGIAILGPTFMLGNPRIEGNDRGSLTGLTAMAAAAWYHDRLAPRPATLEAAVEAAREFAADDYVRALNAGYLLEAAERERIATRLGELTGVPAAAWRDANLRLGMSAFQSLLLRDRGLTIGSYDSRYVLPTRPSGNDPVLDDPAMGLYTPGYVVAFNEYLQHELNVRQKERYVPIAFTDVNFRWDYGSGPGIVLPRNDTTDLAIVMRRNPSLRLFVGTSYYDLNSTLGAAEYALAHSTIPRERLTLRPYVAGHMPYIGEESAAALAADLRAFLRGPVPAPDGKR